MTKTEIRIFILIALMGFLLRIYALTRFPMFTDEAIYAHWAKELINGTLSPFISISDGKTPLFVWTISAVVKLGATYINAGRIISALSFIGTGYFIFALSKKSMKNLWTFVPTLFYALSPFTIFYERMGLMDSLLTFFSTGFLFFVYQFITMNGSLYTAMISGLLLTLAFMTKPSALIFVYTSVCIPLFYLFTNRKKALFSLLLSIPTLVILFLISRSSGFSAYSFKNMEFTYPLSTNWSILWNNMFMNIDMLFPAMTVYFLPLFLLFPFAVLYLMRKKQYGMLVLIMLYMCIPVAIIMVFGRIVFSRYFLSFTPLLFIASGYALMHFSYLKNNILKNFLLGAGLLGTILYFVSGTARTLLNPQNAFLSSQDRWQYITSTASGFGINETATFLKKLDKKLIVVTTQNFGNLPYAFNFAFEHNSNIAVQGTWLEDPKTIRSIISKTNTPVYIVYNLPVQKLPKSSRLLKKIFNYTRPDQLSGIGVYELTR